MIFLELVNHDEMFAKRQSTAIIANDLDVMTEEGKKRLYDLVYTHYEGDALSTVPTCGCGTLRRGQFLNVKCKVCGEKCLYDVNRPLEPVLWIKAPEGVKALINPYAWAILSTVASTSGFNLLEWFCNPQYKPTGIIPKKLPKIEHWMKVNNITRCLNSFYDHFDELMDYALKIRMIKESGPTKSDTRDWISMNRDKIFSQYIPMPSKVCFVVEKSNESTYLDKTILKATNSMLSIVSINNSIRHVPISIRQRRALTAVIQLAAYHKDFIENTVGGKYGLGRKHVYGGRVYFSARAVISSISERHRYDEIYLPWSLGLQLFRVHLTNKLMRKYDLSPGEIDKMFRDYTLMYNETLDSLMCEIIAEAPDGRIPVTFQRNPTLARGSIQLLYVPKVKKDPSINTISFSALALKAPNADYDGDEMNLELALDNHTYKRLARLAPHLGVLDLNNPRQISSNLDMPAPALETAWRWLHHRKLAVGQK